MFVDTGYFLISENCNMNCSYCFYGKSVNQNDVLQRDHIKKMSTETIIKSIDLLARNAKRNNSKISICFFGGEPTLALNEIEFSIAYAREKTDELKLSDPEFFLITNGLVYDDRIVEWLKYENFSMQISFDGLSQDKTRSKGTYSKVMTNIIQYKMELKSAGIDIKKVNIHSVYTPDNIKDMFANYRMISSLGFTTWALPIIEGEWGDEELEIYIRELNLVKNQIKKEILTNFNLGAFFSYTSFSQLSRTNYKSRFSQTCGVGSTMISIDSDGYILPCHRFKTNKTNFPYYSNINGELDIVNDEIEKEKTKYQVKRNEVEGIFKCKDCPIVDSCYMCVAANQQISGEMKKVESKYCKLMLNEHLVIKELEETIRTIGLGHMLESKTEAMILEDKIDIQNMKLTEIIENKLEKINNKIK